MFWIIEIENTFAIKFWKHFHLKLLGIEIVKFVYLFLDLLSFNHGRNRPNPVIVEGSDSNW